MAEMIGYLIHSFPLYSSTFVNDEIDEMRKQGAKLALFAVHPPGPKDSPPDFARFRDETTYVFPMRYGRLCARHLAALASRPVAYLKCLAWMLSRPRLGARNRVRSLYHFVEAIYLYPDIVARGCRHLHVHFLLGGASLALFMNRVYGLSYSLTAHGSDIFVDRLLQPEKLRYARFTRLATEYNAAFLRPMVPESLQGTLNVIPFGVDRAKVPPAEGSRSGGEPQGKAPLRILAVGRLIWQKAQNLLLQACADLDRGGFDFHLLLIGEGPLRSALEDQIRSLGLENRVTMAGAMPSAAVWREYRKADLFVLSSVSEGSPFVIMEAMACGLPVLAPALHGIPEMIRDGEDGLLFRTSSAEDLARKLILLAGDAGLRQRLGRAAAASAADHFDQERSVARFHRLLEPYA